MLTFVIGQRVLLDTNVLIREGYTDTAKKINRHSAAQNPAHLQILGLQINGLGFGFTRSCGQRIWGGGFALPDRIFYEAYISQICQEG